MVPKNAQVSDLLEALQKKAGISDEIMQKTQAYEAHMHKFHKVLPPDHSIMSLYDYTQIFVAPYPDDESSKKVTVFHYDKEPSKPHGVPFQFPIKEVGHARDDAGLYNRY
jgi:ubiquitin carboxyl-terminal hydrolase 7